MAGKSRSNRLQRLGSAFHDIVAHGAVDMDVEISRDQQWLQDRNRPPIATARG